MALIGDMREKIIIQANATSLGTDRGITRTWTEFADQWAEQLEGSFETRYVAGVLPSMRVLVPDVTATVAEALTSTETDVTTSTAAGFPTQLDYRILVDSELMEVTAGHGTSTLTVTRGVDGTTNVVHTNGATLRSMKEHEIISVAADNRREFLVLSTEEST